jgi:hypothetical protein
MFDILRGLDNAALEFDLTVPRAVFAGVSRAVPLLILEYIPSMTREEFALLMTIPGMCVRVDGTDHKGAQHNKGAHAGLKGPLGPLHLPSGVSGGSSSIRLFYHLPSHNTNRENAAGLATKIANALNGLGIGELRVSTSIIPSIIVRGAPTWESKPFLETYRKKMRAYEERKKRDEQRAIKRAEKKAKKEETSGGCAVS